MLCSKAKVDSRHDAKYTKPDRNFMLTNVVSPGTTKAICYHQQYWQQWLSSRIFQFLM
jgi:hypothetical protein